MIRPGNILGKWWQRRCNSYFNAFLLILFSCSSQFFYFDRLKNGEVKAGIELMWAGAIEPVVPMTRWGWFFFFFNEIKTALSHDRRERFQQICLDRFDDWSEWTCGQTDGHYRPLVDFHLLPFQVPLPLGNEVVFPWFRSPLWRKSILVRFVDSFRW